jgi:hypothetical protein
MSCIARTVAECKKKWQDVQGTTKKKEAARRTNAHATGGGQCFVSCFVLYIFILQPQNNARWSLQFYQFLNIVEINLILKTWYRVKIEKTTNNLYLSEANPGYVTLLAKKKPLKKGFLGGARPPVTPPLESAPVDSHILMRHIYKIWVQN